MHRSLPVNPSDYFGPALGAIVFVSLMSLLREPTRRNFNAILVGGAMGAYIGGGLGLWELPFAGLGSLVAYRGLRSHRFIGIAWLMHSAWDLVHHFYGNPIWPFLETSSFGCFVFDALIAVWFLSGAPSIAAAIRARLAPPHRPAKGPFGAPSTKPAPEEQAGA
jgi:hypothetical protein